MKQVEEILKNIPAPDGYSITLASRQDTNSAFSSLYLMLILSVVLVYMVMASQFESLYGPFIIMFSLPPTFIGAIVGLYLTNRTINMNSIMGMIMLVGIVVNNAIVLVDYTNQLRKRGYTLYDALIEAGKVRLRPIMMTTAVTVLAMSASCHRLRRGGGGASVDGYGSGLRLDLLHDHYPGADSGGVYVNGRHDGCDEAPLPAR